MEGDIESREADAELVGVVLGFNVPDRAGAED
jgi:hypothetical protein